MITPRKSRKNHIFWLSLLPQDYGTVYFKQDDYPQADGPVAKCWSAFLELQNDTD